MENIERNYYIEQNGERTPITYEQALKIVPVGVRETPAEALKLFEAFSNIEMVVDPSIVKPIIRPSFIQRTPIIRRIFNLFNN